MDILPKMPIYMVGIHEYLIRHLKGDSMNIGILVGIVGIILSAIGLIGFCEDKPNPRCERNIETVIAKCYPKEI